LSRYSPAPAVTPVRCPSRIPNRVVPSYIGEAGLVGNWLFYSGFGDTLYDFSGEENHGTINGPVWTDEDLASWALNFSGGNYYVRVPSPVSGLPTGSDPFTILVWMKTSSYHAGVWTAWGNDGTTNEANIFRLTDPTVAGAYIRHAFWGNDLMVTSDPGIADNNWHHLAVTYDGTDRIIYVDGSSVASDTPSTPRSPTLA